MKKKNIIIFSIIFIIFIISIIFAYLFFSNKQQNDTNGNKKPSENLIAIFVPNESGDGWKEYDGEGVPEDMILDVKKSVCYDYDGVVINDILNYVEKNNEINILYGGSAYCYLFYVDSNYSKFSTYSDLDDGRYQTSTYYIKKDKTIWRYLDIKDTRGNPLSDANNGYYKLSGIEQELKSLNTKNYFTFYGITYDNLVYEYNCPVSSSSCSGTLIEDYGTNNISFSTYSDLDDGRYQGSTYYVKNDGTIWRWLDIKDTRGNPISNANNGYYELSGIEQELKIVNTKNYFTFYGITTDNLVYEYNCPISSSSCSGKLIEDYGTNNRSFSTYSDLDDGRYQGSTYYVKNDGTIWRWLDIKDTRGRPISDANNGYYELSGIEEDLKSVYTLNYFSFYGITKDNLVYEYNCPVAGSGCSGTLRGDYNLNQ